jgi:hypothetical protein
MGRRHCAATTPVGETVAADTNEPHVVVTVAVNRAVPLGATVVVCGLTATDRILSVTVTVAIAVFVASAALVATTW